MTSVIICISASAKTLNNNDEFNHLIKHALACTLEKVFEDVSNYNELVFQRINEVVRGRYEANDASLKGGTMP